MIQLDNGTRVYPCGEWDASIRNGAVYHARKLGGTPSTKVVDDVLIIWPSDVEWERRGQDVEALLRLKKGAKLEAGTFHVWGTKSLIYFIAVGDTVKIGISRDLPQRLRKIRTGLSSPIDSVYVETRQTFTELGMHKKFAHHRLRGEWFTLGDEIIGFIERSVKDGILRKFI